MNIEVRQENGILCVKPQEKSLEGANSRELKKKITEYINQGNKIIVLNISNIEFMDSSGIGTLITILKLLASQQGKIVLCEVREAILRIFTLTRLDLVFKVFPTEKEAINSLEPLTLTKNNG